MRLKSPFLCPLTLSRQPRMRLIPLLLCCLSSQAWAENLPKLNIAPDLLSTQKDTTPVPSPALAPKSLAPALQSEQTSALPETKRLTPPLQARPGPTEAANPLPTQTHTTDAKTPDVVSSSKNTASAPASTDTTEKTSPPPAQTQTSDTETQIKGDQIIGVRGQSIEAIGNAEIKSPQTTVIADTLRYEELTDIAYAQGHVWLIQDKALITGPSASIMLSEKVGSFEAPHYTITKNLPAKQAAPAQTTPSGGEAQTLFLEGENHYNLNQATWSTCPAPNPDWYVRAPALDLDIDREKGTAHDALLYFKDLPIFYSPWLEFPLANQRQSGFLTPTFGTSNVAGIDISLPYYINLAPNYDATITPRWMGRRGLEMRGEYRYITPNSAGQDRIEWVPNDLVYGGSRGAASIRHAQNLYPGLVGSLNINAVSDDNYLKDLGAKVVTTSTVNLVREARLNYDIGSWWNAGALMQSYQTLDNSTPYRRLPQLSFNAQKEELPGGLSLSLNSEFVAFENESKALPTGNRTTLYPKIGLPLENAGYFIKPQFGLQTTQYNLDDIHPNTSRNPSRSVPITSIDSGLIFERDTQFGGRNFTQTLEPRLYYLYVPYRSQNDLPNFDSALYDINFAQFFSDNIYSGADRVANANQITTALSSRLIDANSGEERLRVALGQRHYFADLKVPLAGFSTRTDRHPDTLAALSAKISPTLKFDSAAQYDINEKETERFNATLRYQPAYAKALSTSFRYTKDTLRDIDLTGQWPLGAGWYGVGRYTKSLKDHRITEALAGLEYNAGCWVFRTAFHRYTTSEDRATQSIFFQLELGGLVSIGSSPVNLLKRSIFGYGNINNSSHTDPIFGEE